MNIAVARRTGFPPAQEWRWSSFSCFLNKFCSVGFRFPPPAEWRWRTMPSESPLAVSGGIFLIGRKQSTALRHGLLNRRRSFPRVRVSFNLSRWRCCPTVSSSFHHRRFLTGCLAAVFQPLRAAVYPVSAAVLTLRVGTDDDGAAAFESDFNRFDDGGQLHAVVGGLRCRRKDSFFVAAVVHQHAQPPARGLPLHAVGVR